MKNFWMALCGVLLLGIANATAATHTIYLLNDFKAANAADVKVFYKGYDSEGNKIEDTSKWNMLPMEETGQFGEVLIDKAATKLGGHQGAKIFKFTFDDMEDWDPEKGIAVTFIHGNFRNSTDNNAWTDDIRFVEGGLYHAANRLGNGLRNIEDSIANTKFFGTEVYEPSEWQVAEKKTYTMYYADTQNRAASGIHFAYWHYNTDFCPDWEKISWDDYSANTKFEPTDRYYTFNGNQIPIYKLTLTWELEPEGGGFLTSSGTGFGAFPDFVNKGLYYDEGRYLQTIESEDDLEDYTPLCDSYKVYFYDTMNWMSDTTEVSIYSWQKKDNKDTPVKEWSDNSFKLTRALDEAGAERTYIDIYGKTRPLYVATIDVDKRLGIVPTHLIFRKIDKTTGAQVTENDVNIQTGNYIFGNEYLYTNRKYNNNGDGLKPELWQKDVAEVLTYYFYNSGNYAWNEDNLNLHMWGEKVDHCWDEFEHEFVVAKDADGKELNYVDAAGTERKVYKIDLHLRAGQTVTGLIFRIDVGTNKTSDYSAQINALYTQGGAQNSTGIKYNDWAKEYIYETVYFYDRHKWYSGSNKIAIHYWNEKQTQGSKWGAFTAVMERAKNEDGSDMSFDATRDLTYPVYSYTFRREEGTDDPIHGLLFLQIDKNGNVVSEVQTADYLFNAGNMYTQGKAKNYIGMENFADYDPTENEVEQTIYFYDKLNWVKDEDDVKTNISLHFWGDNFDHNYLGGWDDQSYVVERVKDEDGNDAVYDLGTITYPLYRFTLYTEKDAPYQKVIFRQYNIDTNKNVTNVQTGELVVVQNALYTQNLPANDEGIAWEEWTKPVNEYTIYFADGGAWGAEDTLVHEWTGWNNGPGDDTSNPFYAWGDNPSMQPTDRYYKVGDVYAQVLKYTLRSRVGPDGLLFHTSKYSMELKTGDMRYVDNALYSYWGNGSAPEAIPGMDKEGALEAITVAYDEIPVVGKWIYFNIGANQLDRTWQWREPCAFFVNEVHERAELEEMAPAYSTDEKSEYAGTKMEMVRPGYYRVYCPDIYRARDVVFYYYSTNHETVTVFPATFSINDVVKIEMVYPTWTTYVYGLNYASAIQSYVTPDRFEDIWKQYESAGLEKLFLNGGVYVDVDGNDVLANDLLNSPEATPDEGLFLFKIKLPAFDKTDKETYYSSFKMSFIDVKQEFKPLADKGVDFDGARGWATFNLGLVAPDKNYDRGYTSIIDNMEYWLGDYVESKTETNDDGTPKLVPNTVKNNFYFYPKNYTVGFNTYNQYGWAFFKEGAVTEDDFIDGEGTLPWLTYAVGDKFWVAVDTHPGHYSVTFLDFNPMPGLEVSYDTEEMIATTTTRTVDYATAQKLHDGNEHSLAEKEGHLFYEDLNVAGVNINVASAYYQNHGDDEVQQYTAKYLISKNDGADAEVLGTGVGMYRVDGLDPTMPNEIALRTVYTHNTTGVSFCSHVATKSATTSPQILTPQVELRRGDYTNPRYANEEKTRAKFDIAFECDYNASVEMASYPDVVCDGASATRLVHQADDVVKKYNYTYTKHTPWDGEAVYSDNHNWAKQIMTGSILRPEPAEDAEEGEDADAGIETYAGGALERNLSFMMHDALEVQIHGSGYVNVSAHVITRYPYLVTDAPIVMPLAAAAHWPMREAAEGQSVDLKGAQVKSVNSVTDVTVPFSEELTTKLVEMQMELQDMAEPVYYNLQGMKIAKPQPGMPCIEVRGRERGIIINRF